MAMQIDPQVKCFDPSSEYFFDEGCFIIEMSNGDDDPDVSIAQARLEPGRTTRWHRLSATTERYVISTGEGLVEVGELPPQLVAAGDVVIIPPEVKQRITNTGIVDLVFLAVCSPRFTPEAYVDIEE